MIWWLGGKRHRKAFGKLDDALAKAGQVAVMLANAETDPLKLENKEVAVYFEAVETLKPHGVQLHHAVKEYAEALKTLQPQGRTLSSALAEYTGGQLMRQSAIRLRE